jgi:hypothetical protein
MSRRKTVPRSGREGCQISLVRQEYQFWYHKYQFWGRIRVDLSSTLPSSVKTVAPAVTIPPPAAGAGRSRKRRRLMISKTTALTVLYGLAAEEAA